MWWKSKWWEGRRKDINTFIYTVLSVMFFDRCWETSAKRTRNLHGVKQVLGWWIWVWNSLRFVWRWQWREESKGEHAEAVKRRRQHTKFVIWAKSLTHWLKLYIYFSLFDRVSSLPSCHLISFPSFLDWIMDENDTGSKFLIFFNFMFDYAVFF